MSEAIQRIIACIILVPFALVTYFSSLWPVPKSDSFNDNNNSEL